ncbi:hypothetical protein J6590_053962 [Homalodisca vitripennis]|nr:hypothetical protein J6590_053962 [Homalodisca vitripennis]
MQLRAEIHVNRPRIMVGISHESVIRGRKGWAIKPRSGLTGRVYDKDSGTAQSSLICLLSFTASRGPDRLFVSVTSPLGPVIRYKGFCYSLIRQGTTRLGDF